MVLLSSKTSPSPGCLPYPAAQQRSTTADPWAYPSVHLAAANLWHLHNLLASTPPRHPELLSLTIILTRPLLHLSLAIHRPHPPMPIQLPMMQPKRRLIRAHIHVAARIAPDAKVPADMQRRDSRRRALHRVLEGLDVGAGGDVGKQVGRLEEVAGEEVVYVAAMAARVVAEAVGARVGFDAEAGVLGGEEGAEVDC
jgi:hypothetical protein